MFSAGNKYLYLNWNTACWCLLVYIFYCLSDVRAKETDGKYFVFLNYPPLWDTHWLGAVAPPLPWTPSLASPQPDFNSSLSAACIAFNFHFLLQPRLNWVLVTAPALAGELWKAKAGASKWLLQRAGNGSERSPWLSPSSSSAALVCRESPGGPNLQLWGFYSCLEQPTWDSASKRNVGSLREHREWRQSTPCA